MVHWCCVVLRRSADSVHVWNQDPGGAVHPQHGGGRHLRQSGGRAAAADGVQQPRRLPLQHLLHSHGAVHHARLLRHGRGRCRPRRRHAHDCQSGGHHVRTHWSAITILE